MATEEELRQRVRALGPFHHAIDLPHGVNTYVPELAHRDVERTRIDSLMRHGWPKMLAACGGSLEGLRVLDIACNCGGFSVSAIQAGAAYVLGIDIVDRYLEQANFVRDALGYEHLEFRRWDVFDLSPEVTGTFDVVLCFGILYHLEDPVRGMRKIAEMASRVLMVDTKIHRPKYVHRLVRKQPIWKMEVVDVGEQSTETTSLWRQGRSAQFTPTERSVTDLLRMLGFPKVQFLLPTEKDLEERYRRRERGTFIAAR